ncbi:MAG UNVERIFIED_CONTAM: ATP-binding cassette domain-containing protein [Planctomycetaceae bacterium]|jgi:ATP-binding cassette subfamily F protein 3
MIILQNISKAYGHRKLLDNVSVNCPSGGKIALIGNNGVGKTSLINILCGFDKDYDGEVIIPREVRLGYLPQIANHNPKENLLEEALDGALDLNNVIKERDEILLKLSNSEYSDDDLSRYDYLEERFGMLGGYRIREDAKEILIGLGFKEEQMEESVRSFSGGWRMRLEFAKMLLNNPNFLILDEPTNHLDLPSIEWFEGYMQKFNGTILFISHDKDLLNRLSTHTLHLRQGKLTPYKGNFDKFLDEFSLKQSQNTHIARHLNLQYEHIEKFVNKFRASATKARQVQSRLKTLAKLQTLQENVEFEEIKDTMNLRLDNVNPSGRNVLKVKNLLIGYDKPLIKPLNFTVEKGQKVAILGMNGLGKSTLLKTILGDTANLGGEITWGHNVKIRIFCSRTFRRFG